ncbi:MAG: 16S rRNA (uracil(1498)-N(3))-methyltransferase [Pseudomonadales bacterium]
MNLLLLDQHEINSQGKAELAGPRAEHLLNVVGVSVGDTIRCGIIGGNMGSATVEKASPETQLAQLTISPQLGNAPPPPSNTELLCALPRPKMLRRMVRSCAELGIKNITFINSFRVEKSYWQSPLLSEAKLREFCIDGLQQSGDTVLPSISLKKRFKPFVEDELPELLQNKSGLLAHPGGDKVLSEIPRAKNQACLVAIGPEGGFIEYEVQSLVAAGLTQFSLGPRILRCDTVIPYLAAIL